MQCSHNFCNLRYNSKITTSFFFLHSFRNRRFVLTEDLSNLSVWFFFSLSWALLPFHLKKHFTAFLWHIQIASITTLELWGTWEQSLEYHDNRSENQDSYQMTKGCDMPDKGVLHVPGCTAQDSITQNDMRSKTHELLTSEFPSNVFSSWLTTVCETMDMGGIL